MNIWYTGIMTGVEGIGQRQKKIIFSIVAGAELFYLAVGATYNLIYTLDIH